jgi:hypothetical protein
MPSAWVRRALFGPGLWPGPRRQARWAGRGLRRSRVGPEDRFCEAVRNDLQVPLTLEGPARTMRGAPSRSCDTFMAIGALGVTPSAWPWAGGRGSGIRRGPQAAGHRGAVRGLPPRRRACVRRTRRSGPPRNGESPVEPRPSTAGHPGRSFLSIARVRPRCSRPGPSGPARRRCALEAV